MRELFTKHFLSKETPIKEPLSVEDYQRLNNYLLNLIYHKIGLSRFDTHTRLKIQSEIESVEGELKMWN